MKKVLFVLSIMLTMQFLISCSNEETCEKPIGAIYTDHDSGYDQDLETMKDLEHQLRIYNDSIIGTERAYNQPGTRGWLRRLFHGIATVFADAVGGAMVGGVITACTGNGIAGLKGGIAAGTALSAIVGAYVFGSDTDFGIPFLRTTNHNNDYYLSNTITTYSENARSNIFQEIDSVGYYHNLTLYDIFEDSDSLQDFSSLSSYEKASLVINRIENHTEISPYISNSDVYEFANFADYLVSKMEENDSYDEFINEVGIDSNSIDLVQLISRFVEGITYLTTNEEKNEYTKKSINAVESSSLSPALKQRIIIGYIIGNASSRLWIDDNNENTNAR